MSHTALRRVAIRLLHDAAFVDALHADPARALADVALSDDERRWLASVPRAAWRTDPGRPARMLAALRDEFPATVGLAPARVAGFPQSPEFHAAVQERGSLAMAFGAYMAHAPDDRAIAIARLETAVAFVRRAPRRVEASRAGFLRLVPCARVVKVAAGAVDLLAAIRDGRHEPRLAADEEPVLVLRTPTHDDVTIEGLPPDLAMVLERAETETRRGELEALIRSRDSSPAEAVEIVDGLVADGVLR